MHPFQLLRNLLFLGLFALLLLAGAGKLRAQSYGPFFANQQYIGYDDQGNSIYYLPAFGYFTYLGASPQAQPYPGLIYKYNFGYLYSFGNSGGSTPDVYFYDFGSPQSIGFLYTDATWGSDALNYLYFYGFAPQNSFLLYFQNTIAPRVFYNYSEGSFLYLD